MKIVAITSCATGIAHSYMAAEAIKKAAKKAGHTVRVEVQGALGQEDTLKQNEIDAADVILFANDVGIVGAKRFDGKQAQTVKISPHEVIKNPDQMIARLESHGKPGEQ